MRCPVCKQTTRVQRTYVITEYLRDIVHCCKNTKCGLVFVTQQEYLRTVVPSLLEEEPDSATPVT